MIAHIAGKLTEKFDNNIIVDVHGVGYEIAITGIDAEQINLGDEVKFYTYHSVRENAEELYGFSSLAAKKLFQLLIGVQGVGPRAAMAILSLAAPEEVRNAIANTDAAFVAKASGVGKKTAQRLILELKGSLEAQPEDTLFAQQTAAAAERLKGARDALLAMGFSSAEADLALKDAPDSATTEGALIQYALRRLDSTGL